MSSNCAIQGKRPYIPVNKGQVESCVGCSCAGGSPTAVYEYLKQYGVEEGSSQCGTCVHNVTAVFCLLTAFTELPVGDEEALKVATYMQGPVAVGFDASHASFQMYSGGIYYEPACSSSMLDHSLLVVGYGSAGAGRDYWIAQNSWGPGWGMNGFILLSRNRGNNCGVASASVSVSTKNKF